MPLHKKSGLKNTEWIVLNIHLTFLSDAIWEMYMFGNHSPDRPKER